MESESETRAPVVDVVESAALLVGPALLGGLGAGVVVGPRAVAAGLVNGGLVGYLLLSVRMRFRAVRTEDGIERRRPDPEETWWTKVADIEYDRKYDRVLAVVLGLVGVGAFGSIPFVDDQSWRTVVGLVMVGLFGITVSLMTYASLSLRS